MNVVARLTWAVLVVLAAIVIGAVSTTAAAHQVASPPSAPYAYDRSAAVCAVAVEDAADSSPDEGVRGPDRLRAATSCGYDDDANLAQAYLRSGAQGLASRFSRAATPLEEVTSSWETAQNAADRFRARLVFDQRGSISLGGGAIGAPNTAGRAVGLADDGVNVIPSSGRTFVGTPRGTVYDVPQGWAPRVADNGRGIVYQRPGALRNADSIRIMDPTSKYPTGYVRYYNSGNQPLDVFGNPGADPLTHIPQDYVGPWPGWPL